MFSFSPLFTQFGVFWTKYRVIVIASLIGLLLAFTYWQFPNLKQLVQLRVNAARSIGAASSDDQSSPSPVPELASLADVQEVQNETKEVDGKVMQQQADIQHLRDSITALQQELQKAIDEVATASDLSQQPVISSSSSSAGVSSPIQTSSRINLNTATAAQLDSLPGIGPAIAQRIVTYRSQKGGFKKVDDLLNVSGIGPAIMSKIKDQVEV